MNTETWLYNHDAFKTVLAFTFTIRQITISTGIRLIPFSWAQRYNGF